MRTVRFINDEMLEYKATYESKPLVVAFWDHWSVPCKLFLPALESVAKEYAGKVPFYKIDIMEDPSITGALDVKTCPTLLLFNGDDEVVRYEGSPKIEKLKEGIDGLLTKNK